MKAKRHICPEIIDPLDKNIIFIKANIHVKLRYPREYQALCLWYTGIKRNEAAKKLKIEYDTYCRFLTAAKKEMAKYLKLYEYNFIPEDDEMFVKGKKRTRELL